MKDLSWKTVDQSFPQAIAQSPRYSPGWAYGGNISKAAREAKRWCETPFLGSALVMFTTKSLAKAKYEVGLK